MTADDFMNRVFHTAWERTGLTSPNPAVGAVIVKDGKIISEGGTGPYGQAHAESSAIHKAHEKGLDLHGAEIYVSLEPCSHYGKTPPCAKGIIDAGISRVYIPLLDPNPVVAGRGADMLRKAGVDVVMLTEYSGQAEDIIRQFKKYILDKKTYIISKSAMTLDGRTASSTGDSKWISGPESRYLVHRLRSKADAVIVGRNTVMADNPSLTVRYGDFEEIKDTLHKTPFLGRHGVMLERLLSFPEPVARNPLRISAGIDGGFSPDMNFFSDENYLVIDTEQRFNEVRSQFPEKKFFFDSMNMAFINGGSRKERVEQIMEILYSRGIMMALLEGGAGLTGAFFDSDSIDQFLYFIAPKIAGAGIPVMRGKDSASMADALKLKDLSWSVTGSDLIISGYKKGLQSE